MAQDEANLLSQLEALLRLASSYGYICQQNATGFWQITPNNPGANWNLQQTSDNRWLLLIKGKPQISLVLAEVFTFLNRQSGQL